MTSSFESRRLELLVPLVVREEIVGAIFLGEKATNEPYTGYEKEIICAMGQHLGVAIAQRNLMAEIERRADENRQLFDQMRSTYKRQPSGRLPPRSIARTNILRDTLSASVNFPRSLQQSLAGQLRLSRVRPLQGTCTTSAS
jgi:GAF domain-containing protein